MKSGRQPEAREPVKKLSSVLKLSQEMLRARQNMEIVDDGAATQIEEILAQATIAGASSLPPANMGEGVFDSHPFAQFGSSLWSLLA